MTRDYRWTAALALVAAFALLGQRYLLAAAVGLLAWAVLFLWISYVIHRRGSDVAR